MNLTEIREMSERELKQALDDNRQELFNLRFQLATRKTKNHQRIPVVKKEIARILTVLRERDLMTQYTGVEFADLEGSTLASVGASGGETRGAKRGGLMGRIRRGGR